MLKIIISILLLHAVSSAMPVENQSTTLSEKRNKKLLNANQLSSSIITYVKPFEQQAVYKQRTKGKNIKTSGKAKSNHELLSSLGLQKSPSSLSSHYQRKRLATHDSRIYIVKLPPSPIYYDAYINRKTPALVNEVNEPNTVEKSKNIPIGFSSNGKPGAIYHWNLPMIAKIFSETNKRSKTKNANFHAHDIDLKNIEKWSSVGSNDKKSSLEDDRVRKIEELSPYYYAPMKKKKQNKQIYSNGKPKAVYLMKDKVLHNLIY